MDELKWNELFSTTALDMKPSPIRELMPYIKKPGIISFAGGNPDPWIFPVPGFAESAVILGRQGMEILQYGDTAGFEPLKQYIAEWMAPRMGRVTAQEEMLITTGSQQGMDLLCSVLINPGDAILVEDPTYPGAIHTMRNRGAQFVTAPCDAEGLQVELLPEILDAAIKEGKKFKFIYTIVNFQNPSGSTLSEGRRKALLEIAEKYDLLIFEDDPYGHLRYEGEDVPTLFSMDTAGRVIYACSFSKILAPGARVAWIVGHPELIRKMVVMKQGVDICTSVVSQALVHEYCNLGHMTEFLPKIVAHYRKKRDAMNAAFKAHLPENAIYSAPEGGFFFWIQIPGVDTKELFSKAIDHGVAFVNGAAFYANGGGDDFLRTCFTFAAPADLEEGAKRLALALKEVKPKKK